MEYLVNMQDSKRANKIMINLGTQLEVMIMRKKVNISIKQPKSFLFVVLLKMKLFVLILKI